MSSSLASSPPLIDFPSDMSASAKRSPLIDLTQDQNVVDLVRDDDDETYNKESGETSLMPAGFVSGSVVGIRCYDGEAHPGEYVELVREPNNPYDSNAVRVDNLSGQKVGHIQRELAAALAPIVDQNIAKLDGTIPSRGNRWKIPICIEFRVPTQNNKTHLDAVLQQHGLTLRTTNVPEALQQPTIQTVRVDWKKLQKQQMDKVFDEQSNERFANLPEMPALPWQQGTDLLSHQKVGIRWMVHRETASDVSVPFFRRAREGKREVWLCDITHSSQPDPPTPVRGGILAGKNLQGM